MFAEMQKNQNTSSCTVTRFCVAQKHINISVLVVTGVFTFMYYFTEIEIAGCCMIQGLNLWSKCNTIATYCEEN